MPRFRKAACIAALFAALGSAAFSQQQPIRQQTPIHLQTRDVTLHFAAGDSAPRLVALTVPGHQPWRNRLPESLPDHVEIAGKSVPLSWKLVPSATSVTPTEVSFVYESAKPHLRLTWQWQASANFGPIEHQFRLENLGDQEVWLPFQDSFQFDFAVNGGAPIKHFFVEKGADTPSPIGTHDVTMKEGYGWEGNSSTYAHPAEGEAREIIPWFLVQRINPSQDGWYVGIEFSGRIRIAIARKMHSLHGAAGLNPSPGPFRTRLPADASFVTPKIFLGGFRGGPDGAGNVLRRWVREVLTNPATWSNPSYPFLVNNSWGSGMAVDEALAHRMIEDSADLQLEMFHIDAGWFRGVGDWYPNPEKFPHGLAAIADDAHRRGLKFGLWVDWSQAALSSAPGALNVGNPKVRDWLVADVLPDWKPQEFKGQTIDIGVPAAKDWAQKEVNRIVDDYHLDMIEHDGYLVAQGCDRPNHPHAAPDPARTKIRKDSGAYFVLGPNSTDVSYHAVRSYYDIYANLRKSHPGLLFEICNDGGRMVDFGSAAHGDYFSITDTYDPLSNRRAFYDTSFVLPPAMLETYVEKWPSPSIENFRYMLRSGMMGWLSIMQDTTAWTAEQHQAAQREFAMYKRRLRPLIRDASLFHISQRPDGVRWDAIEYFDPQSSRGAVYVFRGTTVDESSHNFVLRGLRASSTYKLEFADGSSPTGSASGRQLMSTGLRVTLKSPLTSELVFIEDARASSVRDIKKPATRKKID
jgi:disulfide oxidoreductase YuzD